MQISFLSKIGLTRPLFHLRIRMDTFGDHMEAFRSSGRAAARLSWRLQSLRVHHKKQREQPNVCNKMRKGTRYHDVARSHLLTGSVVKYTTNDVTAIAGIRTRPARPMSFSCKVRTIGSAITQRVLYNKKMRVPKRGPGASYRRSLRQHTIDGAVSFKKAVHRLCPLIEHVTVQTARAYSRPIVDKMEHTCSVLLRSGPSSKSDSSFHVNAHHDFASTKCKDGETEPVLQIKMADVGTGSYFAQPVMVVGEFEKEITLVTEQTGPPYTFGSVSSSSTYWRVGHGFQRYSWFVTQLRSWPVITIAISTALFTPPKAVRLKKEKL